jgi:amino acid transporter
VGNTSKVEIITVYGKLLVLLGLAIFGIIKWAPEELIQGISPKPWHAAIIGSGTIFMAYEGFQLISYDYEDLKKPNKTLPKATIWAVISVILIYILVTFGTTMIVGAETLIEKKEVALSIAGERAMGTFGLVVVTIAAALSTGSAINATLFSTSRLMESVAEKKDLPHLFVRENKANIPYYAVLIIAGLAAGFAIFGSLNSLVDAASIIFLFTFGTVNLIAFQQNVTWKWLSLLGAIGCGLAIAADISEQLEKVPYTLIGLILFTASIFIFRPYLLKKIK